LFLVWPSRPNCLKLFRVKLETSLSSPEMRRKLILVLFFFGGAIWFFYDGLFAWPSINERYAAYQELVEQGKENTWRKVAMEKGWPLEEPEKDYSASEIRMQLIIGGILLISGFGLLIRLDWFRRHPPSANEEGIDPGNGQRVPWDAIVGFDRSKWAKYFIIFAIYESDGKRRKLRLDDYRYDGCLAIIKEAERRLEARTGERDKDALIHQVPKKKAAADAEKTAPGNSTEHQSKPTDPSAPADEAVKDPKAH